MRTKNKKHTQFKGLICPLCGAGVPRGQILAHRVQAHGESATEVHTINAKSGKAKKYFQLPTIGAHQTLISQLHKSQHKRSKVISVTGYQPYKLPKDWNPPRG